MNTQRLLLIGYLSTLVAACGGGSDSAGGDTPVSPPPSAPSPAPTAVAPAGTTQSRPTYLTGGAEATIFDQINRYREQCGFPLLAQNTLLDAAAKAHTDYMQLNGYQVTDTEVVGNLGFTGINADDRAWAKGWPAVLPAATQNAGAIAPVSTDAEYGALIANMWAVGVYHQTAVTWLANLVGVGSSAGVYGGYKTVLAGLVFSSDASGPSEIATTRSPATFPCGGVTGVLPYGAGESPMPPVFETVHTVAGDIQRWGTPVTVEGNASDVIQLSAATYTAPDGTVIQLNRITASNDQHQLTTANKVVAYPTNALLSNTTYTVDMTGTINGVAFNKHFTFTTGN